MLKKLLKYDLKSIFKYLIVFYLLTIFFGILTRIFLNIDNSFILHMIGQICNGVMIAGFINIIINSLIRPWVRFKNNFYGDESYLTHTLPVSKRSLYTSKLLSSLLGLFASFLIIIFTIFIAYYNKENAETIKNIIISLKDIHGSNFILFITTFVLVTFIECANTLQIGYTGILLGFRMNNMKVGFSIIFGFIAHMILQVLTVLSLLFLGIFNKDILNMFFTNNEPTTEIIKTILLFGVIIYTSLFIIEYLFNQYIFKKGVNVD